MRYRNGVGSFSIKSTNNSYKKNKKIDTHLQYFAAVGNNPWQDNAFAYRERGSATISGSPLDWSDICMKMAAFSTNA